MAQRVDKSHIQGAGWDTSNYLHT